VWGETLSLRSKSSSNVPASSDAFLVVKEGCLPPPKFGRVFVALLVVSLEVTLSLQSEKGIGGLLLPRTLGSLARNFVLLFRDPLSTVPSLSLLDFHCGSGPFFCFMFPAIFLPLCSPLFLGGARFVQVFFFLFLFSTKISGGSFPRLWAKQ